jgi:phosphatidylethanolamine-binding protein (PEBP) family uncharacterized protein
MAFTLTSSAFQDGEMTPREFTCDGTDLPPPLAWSDAPEGTRSFALVMEDPDAPRGTFTHWLLYDIPPTMTELRGQGAAKHCETASAGPRTAGLALRLAMGRIDMSSRSTRLTWPPSMYAAGVERRSTAHSVRTRWPQHV